MHDTSMKRDALVQTQQVGQALDAARAANARLINTLEAGLETPLEDPFKAPSSTVQYQLLHRRGTPSRLNTDPELQAFVLARIEHMTYKEVVSDVAKSFPPERQISISALQRWWRKRWPNQP